MGVGAPVFVFEFERNRAEKSGSTFADIAGEEERAEVLTDAIVEVWMPLVCIYLGPNPTLLFFV